MVNGKESTLEEVQPVSVLFFKGAQCAPCKIVEKHLNNIVHSAGKNATKLTIINTDKEIDLVDKYEVRNVPEVYYNDKKVLTAQQASDLLSTGDLEQSLMGASDDSNQPLNLFSQGQNAIFNYLFNHLIEESIRGDELGRETWKKLSLFILSEKEFQISDTDKLSRPRVGDYVHIGALQSLILSFLSLSPESEKYLFEAGKRLGTVGIPQMRFINANPEILTMSTLSSKLRLKRVMRALKKHYKADAYGNPLYLATKARYRIKSSDKAILRIYDSAYAAGVTPIGSPVCHLLAGEIAGLLETTLGSYVNIEETKCQGLSSDHKHCEFVISIVDKKKDPMLEDSSDDVKASAVFSDERKDKCALAIDNIAENMYNSSLMRKKIRVCGDYVHISVLQHVLTSIKFMDPFYGTLLYYAGLHQGRFSQDYEIIERIAEKKEIELPCDFEDACKLLEAYYNDPTTILTRNKASVDVELLSEETAKLRAYECATASGLILQNEDRQLFPAEINDEDLYLCDFTVGFITGRLSKMLDWEVRVKEIGCQSTGLGYCEFSIMLD